MDRINQHYQGMKTRPCDIQPSTHDESTVEQHSTIVEPIITTQPTAFIPLPVVPSQPTHQTQHQIPKLGSNICLFDFLSNMTIGLVFNVREFFDK